LFAFFSCLTAQRIQVMANKTAWIGEKKTTLFSLWGNAVFSLLFILKKKACPLSV